MAADNLEPDILTCRDCGKTFILSTDNKRFFLDRNLSLPTRCSTCRRRRRQEREGYRV